MTDPSVKKRGKEGLVEDSEFEEAVKPLKKICFFRGHNVEGEAFSFNF